MVTLKLQKRCVHETASSFGTTGCDRPDIPCGGFRGHHWTNYGDTILPLSFSFVKGMEIAWRPVLRNPCAVVVVVGGVCGSMQAGGFCDEVRQAQGLDGPKRVV